MELLEVMGAGPPHRSVPTSPNLKPREDKLQIISKLEKCLSENSLLLIGTQHHGKEDGHGDSDNNRIEAEMTGVKGQAVSNEGLILPRKLPNPCLESQNRKELHRELLLNQKIGKNVLNQKSELQKAMEKHKEQVIKRELEAQRQENMTPFEKVIEQRAKKLEILEKDLNEKDVSQKEPEFLQIHAKLRARMDAK